MKNKLKDYIETKVKVVKSKENMVVASKELGKVLKAEREKLGYTLGKMAGKLQISGGFLSHIEQGGRIIPDSVIRKLPRVFRF